MTFPVPTVRLTLVALLIAIAALAGIDGGFVHRPAPAHAAFVGDVNCDADVNPDDAVAILVDLATATPAGGCAGTADFDCDADSDIADVLRILRYSAGIDDAPVIGCAAIDSVTPGTTTEQLAADLAERLNSPGEESRYRALLHVFEALGFGVYTTEGDPVLVGEERAEGDLYFYDFELRMIATAQERGDESTLGDVTATLSDMGITETGGGQVTAASMRSRLLDGVDAAFAGPDAPGSFLAMLVRELGLARDPSYDLRTDVPLEDIRLSAAQQFLIVADVGAYFVFQNGPVDVTASQLVDQSSGVLHSNPSGVAQTCEEWGKEIKQIWGVGVFVAGLTAAGPAAVLAAAVIDGLHGVVLAYGVAVVGMDNYLDTHYGHETPGKELSFRVLVTMQDDLGEISTKCGWLAGVEFPPKGPIEGVEMKWSGRGGLERNGMVTCPASTCEKTAADTGIATLVFQPDQEHEPYGGGVEHHFRDVLIGTAYYLSRHNNILGKVNERFTPKEAEFNWHVSWEAPSCITNGSPLGGAATTQGGFPIPTIPPELAGLPCAFAGTASGTMHDDCCMGFYVEDGTNESTITFGNPVWNGFSVEYEATAGQATWHSEGTLNTPLPCPFSQGGTEGVYGNLYIWERGGGQLAYSARVRRLYLDRELECPQDFGTPIIENIYLLDTCPEPFVDRATDGTNFSGSCRSEHDNWWEEYDWNFQAGECNPAPVPVCQ